MLLRFLLAASTSSGLARVRADSSSPILTIAGIGTDGDDVHVVDFADLEQYFDGRDPDENPSTPDGIHSRCPSPRTTPRKLCFVTCRRKDDMLIACFAVT